MSSAERVARSDGVCGKCAPASWRKPSIAIQPATRHRPCVNLRPARPDEAERLTAIAHAAKRHWGYPESWIRLWREQLTLTPAYLAANPTFVAELDGKAVAFASVVLENATATLDHLWVLPEAMGFGIGRALFQHAEKTARQAGCTKLATTADPYAEAFYQKMGLVTMDREDASLDGQTRFLPLMEKSLGS